MLVRLGYLNILQCLSLKKKFFSVKVYYKKYTQTTYKQFRDEAESSIRWLCYQHQIALKLLSNMSNTAPFQYSEAEFTPLMRGSIRYNNNDNGAIVHCPSNCKSITKLEG